MSDPLQQKTIIDPSLSDVLALHKQDILTTLNCIKIGKIASINPTSKTVTVQLALKRQTPSGTTYDYPVLVDCPIFTPQGGGAYLQFPVDVDDQCIVLFSDKSIDEWFANGQAALPANQRMHHLSDGIVLVGLNFMNDGSPDSPTDKFVLSYEGSIFQIDDAGIELKEPGMSEIDMAAGIITLKNNTTTLLTLMNVLIMTIEAIQVTGPLPLTPASIAALEAVKLQMAALLG